jgi:hypothetical protein
MELGILRTKINLELETKSLEEFIPMWWGRLTETLFWY